MLTKLLNAISATSGNPDAACTWVSPFTPSAEAGKHQFVLFLKPEVMDVPAGVNVEGILQIVLERLEAFDVEIGAAAVLPSRYLGTHSLMDQHYGVINNISKHGVDAITTSARGKLDELFGDAISEGATVLGGHQFIEAQPEISALALCTLNENLGTVKLGGGCYAMQLSLLGKTYILLNPFHPYQLVPYTTPGKCIVVLEGLSSTPWLALRRKLTGATDPEEAIGGSIRNAFLTQKKALGLHSVRQGTNGVHLSAGPLEGMVELQRFFSRHDEGTPLPLEDTNFGKLLLQRNLTSDQLAALTQNPTIHGEPAFDLTEELDASAAADLLTA